MKCPECDGTGKVVHPMMSMNGDEYTGEWEQHDCEACNGTGEYEPFDADIELDKLYPTELTNEEHLKSLDTEQLAEWIAHQTMIALLENQNNHSLRMTYPAYWVEWLKQPHTNKE